MTSNHRMPWIAIVGACLAAIVSAVSAVSAATAATIEDADSPPTQESVTAAQATAAETPTAETPAAEASAAETAAAETATSPQRPPTLTPLALAFAAILQDEAERLRALDARFAAAADANAALTIEREIAALKSGTELRLMEAAARVAREQGRLQDAARIEAALTQMQEAAARPPVPRREPLRRGPRGEDGSDAGGSQ